MQFEFKEFLRIQVQRVEQSRLKKEKCPYIKQNVKIVVFMYHEEKKF